MLTHAFATIATLACSAATIAPPGEPVEFGSWSGTQFRIPGGPDWLAADEDNVYVRLDDQHVDVLDPATGSIASSIEAPGGFCQGIGAGFGSIWTCAGTDVARLDPATGEVLATVVVNKTAEQGHLAAGFERVWVLTGDGSRLVGIDPETNAIADEITLDARCLDVAVDETSVWVACALDDVVLRVDPSTLAVADRVDVTEPRGVAFSAGAVWIGAASTVVHLDAESLDVVATVDGGVGRVGGISADDEAVWVRRAGSPLVRIDPPTDEVTDELDLGEPSGGDVLVAHGAVWATAYDDAALFRINLG